MLYYYKINIYISSAQSGRKNCKISTTKVIKKCRLLNLQVKITCIDFRFYGNICFLKHVLRYPSNAFTPLAYFLIFFACPKFCLP